MTCAAPPDMMIDTTAAKPLRRIISGTTGERGGGGPPPLPPRAPHNNSDRGLTLNTEEARGGRSNPQYSSLILLTPQPTRRSCRASRNVICFVHDGCRLVSECFVRGDGKNICTRAPIEEVARSFAQHQKSPHPPPSFCSCGQDKSAQP